MTAKEALEKSIEMWQYIKDNKCEYKTEYFTDNNKEYVTATCYLCEYAKTDCEKCPVKNWSINGYVNKCINRGSVYHSYYNNRYDNNFWRPAFLIADDMLFVLKRALHEINYSNSKE